MLLPATPGWVSLQVVVGVPHHSWLRVSGAAPRHSWLGSASSGGGCFRRLGFPVLLVLVARRVRVVPVLVCVVCVRGVCVGGSVGVGAPSACVCVCASVCVCGVLVVCGVVRCGLLVVSAQPSPANAKDAIMHTRDVMCDKFRDDSWISYLMGKLLDKQSKSPASSSSPSFPSLSECLFLFDFSISCLLSGLDKK